VGDRPVCRKTAREVQLGVYLENIDGYNLLIYFDLYGFLIGVGLLAVLLPILRWRKRSLAYLLFFSIFWVYLLFVIRTVIFPIAINFDPINTRGFPDINLIPFYIRYCSPMTKYCFIEIVGNIILTVPLGFGINFLARLNPKKALWLALLVGPGFELSQLIISLVFRSGFRAVDINDAILNAFGVLIGYSLFRIFAWIYLKISAHFAIRKKWLLSEIYDVAFQALAPDEPKNA
jgi:glycopeptide antibiotics resistance protein